MVSSQSYTSFSTPPIHRCRLIPPTSRINPSFPMSNSLKSSKTNLRCNSTGDSGENVCKTTVDAFFLGKAIGDVLMERIQSSVGEFLGVFGRLQTEQLKHISQFQEEVLEKARRAKETATLGLVSSTVKEATHEVEELVTSTAKQATQGLITEANSTLEQVTQLVSEVEQATQLVSEAASTVEQATQEAQGLASEAASTVEQVTSEAQGLISEATSKAKQATEEAHGLISEATSTVSDASKTISSITGSVISEASSSLLNPKSEDPFLGFFRKD
ncbi:hypothetical protein C2S51_027748 [Perilla frutescens var. frutescens]|nr:hypothetical protein C2S51_027748 [Perilla frutescens var. frutescens]